MNQDPHLDQLCLEAIKAMKKAYAPYSGYSVGAALECADGTVYTGCNIENASFTPTVCAERVAIFKAVSDGKRDFLRIAVVGGKNSHVDDIFPPCGVCRQVMSEFCGAGFEILMVRNEEPLQYEIHTLAEMLPYRFTPDHLQKKSSVSIDS